MAIKRMCSLIFFSVTILICSAQDNSNSVIESAMRDEMKRSMDSLVLKGYDRPFFIAYTISDIKSLSIGATLGSLTYSNEYVNRDKYTRVMVGDYDFNDESLDPRGNGNSTFPSNDIAMPIEDDYLGIRRSLWSSTDAIYKSAGKIYQDNLFYAEQQKKSKDKIRHRSFVKTPTVKMKLARINDNYDKNALEEYVRNISELFIDRPDIELSRVILSCNQGMSYIINSEGTEIQTPINLASLFILAATESDDNQPIFDQILHFTRITDLLPKLDQIKIEIDQMLADIEIRKTADKFDESYDGPVLFLGEAVPSLIEQTLLDSDILVANQGVALDAGNLYDEFPRDVKIGKKIVSRTISVSSRPSLKSFGGVDLLGAYEVDYEGVIPADELVLIDKGVLKSVMNDRTVVDSIHSANGHRRISQNIGPGVIEVKTEVGDEISTLKAKLIEAAIEEGLEFAVIIRKLDNDYYGQVDVYRVSLKDGEEVFLKSAMISSLSAKSLNKVIGVSRESMAYNLPSQGELGLTSVIVPAGILLEDVEIEEGYSNFENDKSIVENPVGIN